MTTYAPGAHHLRRPHVNPWLIAVVTLSAALVGLAAWVLVDRYTSGTTPAQSATTLIDKIDAAVSANDTNALASLYAKDVVVFAAGDKFVGRAQLIQAMENGGHFDIKRIAPVTVNGEFATTYEEGSSLMWPIVATFQIRNDKVIRSWEFVEGETAPFNNALMR